jgi:phage terminase small subunit
MDLERVSDELQPDGLTPKQAAFIREYVVDFNIGRAALRAGYGKGENLHTASVKGSQLLADPRILQHIHAYLANAAERANLTKERILEELSVVAFSNIDHYTVDDNGNPTVKEGAPLSALRAVSRIKKRTRYEKDADGNMSPVHETEIFLWNKVDGLSMAMKHRGMFVEKRITVKASVEELMRTIADQEGHLLGNEVFPDNDE